MSTAISSGAKTADAVILDRRGVLMGVQIITDKTNDLELEIYDNASAASGTLLFHQQVTGTDDALAYWFGDSGIRCENGLYADITLGAGAGEYIVLYK